MMEYNVEQKVIFAFDFDGVLCDSRKAAIEEINKLRNEKFAQLPFVSDQDDLAYLFAGPLKTSLRRFGLTDEESSEFFDLHSARMRERANTNALFPAVVKTFLSIPKKQKFIVTSAYSEAVKEIFKKAGYNNFLSNDQILGREMRIPKSAKFDVISKRTNIKNAKIIKIGDMVSDILYAQSKGVEIIAVGWGYHPHQYLNAFAPNLMAVKQMDLNSIILKTLNGEQHEK